MTRHAWALLLTMLLAPLPARAGEEPAPAESQAPAAQLATDQPTAEPTPSGQQPTPPTDGPEAIFGRLDVDRDGEIAEDEVPEDQRRFFRRLQRTADRDANGRINRDEFAAGIAERPAPNGAPGQSPAPNFDAEQFFRVADRNGDGKLSLDEFPEERREALRPRLEGADRDGDGALSKEEFADLARALADSTRGQPDQRQSAPSGRPPSAGGERLFVAIDADGDGALSAEEIAAATDALQRLDANGDGSITREELIPPATRRDASRGRRQSPEAIVSAADRDGDGRLSKLEAPAPLQAGFERADANADGFVDVAELGGVLEEMRRAAQGQALLRRFAEADRNGDAKLSREEAPEQLREGFDRLDADSDGLIDGAEVREFLASQGGVPGGLGLRRLIRQADRDGDGKVSREEAPERIRGLFDRLDANGDGYLDEQEVRDRAPAPGDASPAGSERQSPEAAR